MHAKYRSLRTFHSLHKNLRLKLGKWAEPCGTAMQGQPVIEAEQAPAFHPLAKISLISKRVHDPRIRY